MRNKIFSILTFCVIVCWMIFACQSSDEVASSYTSIINADSVVISPETLNLTVGNSAQLSLAVTSDATSTWSSSDTTVAKVDAEGNVTAMSIGAAVITAVVDGHSGTCSVSVSESSVAAKSITLSTPKVAFSDIGQSLLLTSDVYPENATDVAYSWTSSNADVATVSASGVVTSVGEGTADISLTTTTGLTAVCTVNVLSTTTTTTYSVTTSKCAGCGDCLVCPSGAITISGRKATINASKCTGCGTCYSRCKHGAIKVTVTDGIKSVTI